MSIAATKWVWEQKGIPLPTRAVLLAVADMINRKGEAWPSVSTIADRCEISERMVQRHLSNASELGVLTINRAAGKRSTYSIPTPDIYDTPTNSSPLTNSSLTPEQYDTPPLYKNRNGTVNKVEQREPEEKKEFPDWFKTLLRITTKRGEEPVTEKLYEPILEWSESKGHSESNLENTALYIESAWTGQLKKRTNVRATFMNLVNREASNGFNAKRMGQPNTENSYSAREQHAPSPLL
jgi:hypothetical protein